MAGTVNGDPLKSFKQHSKILKDHLQEPYPDLKDLSINIWLFMKFNFVLLLLRYLLSVIINLVTIIVVYSSTLLVNIYLDVYLLSLTSLILVSDNASRNIW